MLTSPRICKVVNSTSQKMCSGGTFLTCRILLKNVLGLLKMFGLLKIVWVVKKCSGIVKKCLGLLKMLGHPNISNSPEHFLTRCEMSKTIGFLSISDLVKKCVGLLKNVWVVKKCLGLLKMFGVVKKCLGHPKHFLTAPNIF